MRLTNKFKKRKAVRRPYRNAISTFLLVAISLFSTTWTVSSQEMPHNLYSDPLSVNAGDESITIDVIIRDFKESHPDFEQSLTGLVKGLVSTNLGINGRPVFIGNNGAGSITDKDTFDQWYKDVDNINLHVVKQIMLTETSPGAGIFIFDDSNFFPIDNELFGNEGNSHNYHFTLELHINFTYKGGEVFEFSGDDDVWVFINQELVIDLGGIHPRVSDSVNLDDLNLQIGTSYSLDLFFAERRTNLSEFRIVTSIDAEPETIFDLPFNYSDNSFFDVVLDTDINPTRGTLGSYFDHMYPTYFGMPSNNCTTCAPGDLDALNFYGIYGHETNPYPPYRVQYNGHDGIDFSLQTGTPVLSAGIGIVSHVGFDPIKGNYVAISHPNGYLTEYWHLETILVSEQSPISRDISQPIGIVGDTGNSTGNHLHFKVINPSGVVVDPFGWLPIPGSTYYGQADPWERWNLENNGGQDATSHYLWATPLMDTVIKSETVNTIITSPSTRSKAFFPIDSYNGYLELQLIEMVISPIIRNARTLYSFSLFGYDVNRNPVTSLLSEIEISVELNLGGLHPYQLDQIVMPTLYLLEPQTGMWIELPTSWDPNTFIATTHTNRIGTIIFTVQNNEMFLPWIRN